MIPIYIFSTYLRPSILKKVSKTFAVTSQRTNLLILTEIISPKCRVNFYTDSD